MKVSVRKGKTLRLLEGHRYVLEEKERKRFLPSVTEMLRLLAREGLEKWRLELVVSRVWEGFYEGIPREEFAVLLQESMGAPGGVSAEAAGIGSRVHEWIEAYLAGKLLSPPLGGEGAIRAFVEWFEDRKPMVLASERIVCSPELGYAGTVDLVARLDGELTVVDFKTSGKLYPEYELQLGGYAIALEEWESLRVQRGLLVRVGKDGTCEEKEVHLPSAKEAFKALVLLYHYLKRGTENTYEVPSS